MSSASPSRVSDARLSRRWHMRYSLWPDSLFGRLLAASVLALLVAQLVSLVLVVRERERFILQGSVREWSRRIADVTTMLQGMDTAEREAAVAKLSERPWRYGRRAADVIMFRSGLLPPPEGYRSGPRPGGPGRAGPPPAPAPQGMLARVFSGQIFVPLSMAGDFESNFAQQLQSNLGTGFHVQVSATTDASRRAIAISGPLFSEGREAGTELYDTSVVFPDGFTTLFRITRTPRGALVPRGLFMNLLLLLIVMVVVLFVVARSITRPLSELARAADRVGRDLRQPKLVESGARELRNAARAFNTMQDRLKRYMDSRSRVLAAMSHDLKTPLTRLRLQVEILEDQAAQARIARQLDEMESMVHGALALFRGLDDDEAFAEIDINALLATLQSEFAEMNAELSIEGRALRPVSGKPQALRRCLTNLIANAVKFGGRAEVLIEEAGALVIRIRDEGPGIPAEELEKVFEPFYRVESSRNRDTGGTGLGLSIARDVIQAHGGSIALKNRPVRGLEAVLTLPR